MSSRPSIPALIATGLIGGLLAGFFGVGGGIIMVPLLLVWAGIDQRRAQATSLLAIAPAAIIGSTSYAMGGIFPILPALLVSAGALVGAQLGALLLRRLSLGWLRWLFIVFVAGMSVLVIFTIPDRGVALSLSWAVSAALVGIGVVMGASAGLFGIGGGIIVIPTLMVFFGVGDLEAKGLSLLAMAPAALSGSWSHLKHGVASIRDGLWVAGGALVATPLGSLGAFWIPEHLANPLFGAFGLAIALLLTVRAIGSSGSG